MNFAKKKVFDAPRLIQEALAPIHGLHCFTQCIIEYVEVAGHIQQQWVHKLTERVSGHVIGEQGQDTHGIVADTSLNALVRSAATYFVTFFFEL